MASTMAPSTAPCCYDSLYAREAELDAAAPVDPIQMPSAGAQAVVRALLAAHEGWFDVEAPALIAGRRFVGHATYREHGERYVLSKKAKLWEVDTGEHLLFDAVPHLSAALLANYVTFMRDAAVAELVHPAPNHMSTNVGLVLVADAVDEEAARVLRSTRYRKNYRFGVWGWTDLRLAAIDLSRAASGFDVGRTPASPARTRLFGSRPSRPPRGPFARPSSRTARAKPCVRRSRRTWPPRRLR